MVANAETIVSDGFDYTAFSTGLTPMNANWSVHSGTNPTIALTHATLPVPNVAVDNAVTFTSFSETITGDFELSVKGIHRDYSRVLWFGLFNAAGTNGYVLDWNSSTSNNFAGQGYVTIRRYDSAPTSFASSGVALTANIGSGHLAANFTTGAPFADLKLTWVDATNTLSLSVDGIVKASIVDETLDPSSFARIYLAGNGFTRYDDVLLTATIPEPSTYAMIFGGITLVGALCQRRRHN